MRNNTCLVATFGAVETRKALTARSDAELIVMVRERGLGWKLAFNVLLGRHRDWLLRHCVFRLGNRHDAQDVTQQVMLRAWQAIGRFEGRSAFRTWLYTIAENQCRSVAVKRMRYVQTEHIERLIDLYLVKAQVSPMSNVTRLTGRSPQRCRMSAIRPAKCYCCASTRSAPWRKSQRHWRSVSAPRKCACTDPWNSFGLRISK